VQYKSFWVCRHGKKHACKLAVQTRQKMLAQADDAPYLYAEMARRRLKQGVAAPAHGEKALIEEARRWNDARILRRYLHARQRCGEYPAGEWMAWARAVADRLDPAFEPRRANSPGAVFPVGPDGRS
jgi:hypothetical protein